MSYSNIDKLTAVVAHWLAPMADGMIGHLMGDKISCINKWAKSVFPLADNYSILNDLGFLIKPSVDMIVSPAIKKLLVESGVDDAQIPGYAKRIAESMMDECNRKGSITIFNTFVLSGNDISELIGLLENNLPAECVAFEVIE